MLKKIEIFLRKVILELLLLFARNKNRSRPTLEREDKILVIRLNRIGDALVTTPLISVLSRYGNFEVSVLADSKNRFIFENNPSVKKIFVFEKGLKGFRKTIKELNKQNFALVIDAHPDVSTTVSFIISSLKNTFKIGFKKGNEKIYSDTIPPLPKEKYHIIERLLQFADYLHVNYPKNTVNVEYPLDKANLDSIEETLKEINPQNKFLVGVNISAGSEARFWGTENFRKLLDLIKEKNVEFVLLCAPSDSEKALEILAEKEHLFVTENFNKFASMISKLDLLFTPDTSVVHLASAYEVPLFGIYVKFKTTEKEWFPFRSDYEIVTTYEPNFKNLSFESVRIKFEKFLEKKLNEHNSRL